MYANNCAAHVPTEARRGHWSHGWLIVSHHVAAWNQTWVLCETPKWSCWWASSLAFLTLNCIHLLLVSTLNVCAFHGTYPFVCDQGIDPVIRQDSSGSDQLPLNSRIICFCLLSACIITPCTVFLRYNKFFLKWSLSFSILVNALFLSLFSLLRYGLR